MADAVNLRYKNRDVVFEKNDRLVAVRPRAGMAKALAADLDAITIDKQSPRYEELSKFNVVELRPSTAGIDPALDWLRARPSVAAASHVFMIQGCDALMVPEGHIRLLF